MIILPLSSDRRIFKELGRFMLSKDNFMNARSWPFEEAKKIVERIKKTGKKEVILETGYGPSGLPHIGTFGEVLRTTFVMRAFRNLTDLPARKLRAAMCRCDRLAYPPVASLVRKEKRALPLPLHPQPMRYDMAARHIHRR